MKRTPRTIVAIAFLALASYASSAMGYYDDVHYALNYYIARQAGYTPEQAYRIAKACLSVDYAMPTEPVQAASTRAVIESLLTMPSSQEPRWRFHAFRNEIKFPNSVGNGAEAGAADEMIHGQRVALLLQGIEAKNPGVFLHFFQDEIPHARYGSAWGHWGIVNQKDIDQARTDGLQLGGSTDYLSFRSEQSNLELAQKTFEVLASAMAKISPAQKTSSPFDPNDFTAMLTALREANPVPVPLQGKTLEVFADLKSSLAMGASSDIIGFLSNQAGLGSEETQDIRKHLSGPALEPAIRVVNTALARARMSPDGGVPYETVPVPPSESEFFQYDWLGRLKSGADQAVLVGTLKVRVVQAGGETDQLVGDARVVVRLAKTRPEDTEYALGDPKTASIDGEPAVFENLPIGKLIVEVTGADQAAVTETFDLDRQVDELLITLEPAPTRDLRGSLANEEEAIKQRVAALTASREAALSEFTTALEATQGQVAQREAAGRERGTASSAPASGLATELAGAAELCSSIEAAGVKLAAALAKIESDGDSVEQALLRAQRLATGCADQAAIVEAENDVRQAEASATEIDRQATALALLALQVDDLNVKRTQLLQKRTAASSLIAQTSTSGTNHPPQTAIDSHSLRAALAELTALDDNWANKEADALRARLAPLRANSIELTPAEREAMQAGIARLDSIIDQVPLLAMDDAELQRRSTMVYALEVRAGAATGSAATSASGTSELRAAVQAAACLDQVPVNVKAGMEQANTAHALAQLALDKLGGQARAQIQICKTKLGSAPIDKEAAVAAKHCSYPGSEAIWSEKDNRPMCRCKVGSRWNEDQSECIVDKEAAVAAKHCSYDGSEAIWSEKDNRPMCRCKAGSRWNDDQSACVVDKQAVVAQADCSRYPNTEPSWSEDRGKVVCGCLQGMVSNAQNNGCVPDPKSQLAIKTCSTPNSEPYWNDDAGEARCRCVGGHRYSEISQECELDTRAQVQAKECYGDNEEAYWDSDYDEPRCRCIAGHERNPTFRDCEPNAAAQMARADCSDRPHTEAHWNPANNRAECRCIEGYREDYGVCEPDIAARVAAADCSRYPNTEPRWNDDENGVRCECVYGTHYDRATGGCRGELSRDEQVAALDCSEYANTDAYWDTNRDKAMCGCRNGYQTDYTGTGCEAKPVVIACDTASKSGANPPETITVNIGSNVGTADFSFDMFEVADQMTIEYGGGIIADTGCVSGSKTIQLDLTGSSSQVIIRVNPNCRQSDETKWNFTLGCPR